MKSLLFGFVVPFFAILSLFGVGYSTWYFVNDAINEDKITISTDITGVADFGKIVINYDKNSVEDISPSSLNSKMIVESDGIHLINPFYVHYLLPKGALISSAGNVLKFNLQLTVDSGYVAGKTVADIMKVSYLPYSHGNSSDGKLINVDEKKVVVTTPADNTERRIVTYNGIQWRQDIELVSSKDATPLDYNKFTVSDEGKVEEDDVYKVVSPSDSTLREADKTDAKDTFVFCSDSDSNNLSFNFPAGFRITDNSDEVDVKKNVYLYKDIVQIFSNAKISFTFSVSL